MRTLLIGFGNMGQALARGWLANGHPADAIEVVDPDAAARAGAEELNLNAQDVWRASEQLEPVDVVVLAVKPARFDETLNQYQDLAARGPVFLSIVAGKQIAAYTEVLGAEVPIVRAMPNTPAAIGHGITALCMNAAVSDVQRSRCADLMAAVGTIVWLDDESLMDAVTAVSGSGPAYVFLMIECLIAAGIEMGLPARLAEQLATATVAGAGVYAHESANSAAELRQRVTSPDGTTEAALKVLMGDGGMDQLIRLAVTAATARSAELSAQ